MLKGTAWKLKDIYMLDDEHAFASAYEEVVRLHGFIERWFRGQIARDRFDADFSAVLHPEFENIQPAGKVCPKDDIVNSIKLGYGTNAEFRIIIEEPRLLGVWGGLILFGYVEYQTGARQSEPENRRRSTALFETSPGLRWRYLQETGLAQ